MAKKILKKAVVKRQSGKLYFIDKAGNVCETSMNRKGGKKGRKVCGVKPKKRATKKAAPKKRTTKKRVAKKSVRKTKR